MQFVAGPTVRWCACVCGPWWTAHALLSPPALRRGCLPVVGRVAWVCPPPPLSSLSPLSHPPTHAPTCVCVQVLFAAEAPSIASHRYAPSLMRLRGALQQVFAHLAYATRRAYDPAVLVQACADDPPGFFVMDAPVCAQNDANEFFNLLTDRAGDCFPGTTERAGAMAEDLLANVGAAAEVAPAAGVPEPRDVMSAAMGGSLVHQLIGTGQCPHRKDRVEAFMCVSLEVTGKSNVLESLHALVESEVLSGDNAYLCDVCGKTVRVATWRLVTRGPCPPPRLPHRAQTCLMRHIRAAKRALLRAWVGTLLCRPPAFMGRCAQVETVRRSCFNELPNTLVLHLKRFELDFDTMAKVKVNSKFSFPEVLDLFPFTAEGMPTHAAPGSGSGASEAGASRGVFLMGRPCCHGLARCRVGTALLRHLFRFFAVSVLYCLGAAWPQRPGLTAWTLQAPAPCRSRPHRLRSLSVAGASISCGGSLCTRELRTAVITTP